jgi:acetyl-CoA carboxylase biotin carboxyl carrier protein
MTIDDINKLVKIVSDTGISELEVHWGNDSVRIRGAGPKSQELVVPTILPVPMGAATVSAAVQPSVAAAPAEVPKAAPAPPEPPEEPAGLLVKSPIVGTYYDSPSPGSPSFVQVGDRVEAKQVLCIIESMKLMNEIEAEIAGVVLAKHVENGRPVEYGESLFTLRPA